MHDTTPILHMPHMFIADIGYTQEVDGDRSVGRLEVTDHLRIPGSGRPRPSVLATMADVHTGVLASRQTAPSVALTLDLAVWTLAESTSDWLEIEARPLKVGRTTLVYEAELREPTTGVVTTVSHVTFVASPRPQDVMPPARERPQAVSAMEKPFADALGAHAVSAGAVEASLEPYVSQSTGSMQGGVIALLAELAAESGSGAPVLDLDVRYLSSVRTGPARAVASPFGPGSSRVEVRDTGRDDRLCALAYARTGRA